MIKNIALGVLIFGVCGVPGAIETGEWIPTAAAIVIGGFTYLIIRREWNIEEEDTKHRADHGTCPRPNYLSRS